MDLLDLETKETQRLWESSPPYLESLGALMSDVGVGGAALLAGGCGGGGRVLPAGAPAWAWQEVLAPHTHPQTLARRTRPSACRACPPP
jgi:hypothetical protein